MQAELVVTGLGWLGKGIRSYSAVLKELIAGATSQLDVTAYSITPGADEVLGEIDKKIRQGILVRLVIDDIEGQSELLRKQLREMSDRNSDGLKIWTFPHHDPHSGLHAKVVVADRSLALIGSANLSFRGLNSAHELAIRVGPPAATSASACIDGLIASKKVDPWP